MQFLDATYGRNKLLEIAFTDKIVTTELFGEVFGKELDTLEDSWKKKVLSKYEVSESDSEKYEIYRTATPVSQMNYCIKGKDF